MKALLWDVDGTLAETERDGHRVAFNQAFEALGIPWRWAEAEYGRLLSVTGGRERLLAYMARRAQAPASAAEREALAARLHQRKNACYAALIGEVGIALRPGVRELIAEAHEAGLRQAITTTTSRANVEALLTPHFGAQWSAIFELAVCGEDVARKKPDPEVFLRALNALGLSATEALAIEDSPMGVAAARAAGVPVVVPRSIYFADAPIDGALAIGPGLDARAGWRPALKEAAGGRVRLDDLRGWFERPGR